MQTDKDTIETTIHTLEELLWAAGKIQMGLARRDRADVLAGLEVFDAYTDGHWNQLVVRPGTRQAREFLDSRSKEG